MASSAGVEDKLRATQPQGVNFHSSAPVNDRKAASTGSSVVDER